MLLRPAVAEKSAQWLACDRHSCCVLSCEDEPEETFEQRNHKQNRPGRDGRSG